jgi:hypothetical protein
MRHSDPKLTSNIYTDARLLDLHGAVESLPDIASVVTSVAPTHGASGHFEASCGNDGPAGPIDGSCDGATKNPAIRRVS